MACKERWETAWLCLNPILFLLPGVLFILPSLYIFLFLCSFYSSMCCFLNLVFLVVLYESSSCYCGAGLPYFSLAWWSALENLALLSPLYYIFMIARVKAALRATCGHPFDEIHPPPKTLGINNHPLISQFKHRMWNRVCTLHFIIPRDLNLHKIYRIYINFQDQKLCKCGLINQWALLWCNTITRDKAATIPPWLM